tara:strand:+ start:107 stop:364 length:258 start_codon:yes stop_codon:yes gene_type:complete
MAPLGLGLSTTASEALGGGTAAVFAEDYMWELDGAGALKPIPTTYDFHDTWDLDGTDYTLQAVGDIGDEGYWDLDTNSDVQPLDV